MRFLRLYYRRFLRDQTPRLAASLSFYTVFALAPFLLLLMAVAGFLGVNNKFALTEEIRDLVRPEAAEAARTLLAAVSTPTELTSLIGVVSALAWAFSASLLMNELRVSLTLVQADREVRSDLIAPQPLWQGLFRYLESRFVSLVFVFVFTIIALVTLMVSSYLASSLRHHAMFYIRGINLVTSFVVCFVAFAVAYFYLPKCRVSFRGAVRAALITSCLFVIGKELIGIYLGRAAFASIYGAAGSLPILLVWIYYSSLILLMGAQLSAMWRERTARAPIHTVADL